MTPEEIEACWKDPQNRKWGVYYCKADPRVVVPKFQKWMGWTLNFARPSVIPVLLGMIVLIGLPFVLVRIIGAGGLASFLTLAASIVVLCLLCAYLSSPKRWGR